MLSNVQLFNDKQENIMTVVQHRSQYFVITCKHQIDYKGILNEFELRGYLLETYRKEGIFRKYFIHMLCDVMFDDKLHYLKGIFIQDFIADSGMRDQGFGSLMMKQLIQYAQVLNAQYISGRLSFVDIGNSHDYAEKTNGRERLYHFYHKHGFEISENNRIVLYL